ncbi:MAG: hypothetical protein V4666_01550 [Bacteroidota bacterium]
MKNILFISIFFICVSCKKNNFEERVFEDVSNSGKLEIDLKNYTDFEWDTVYVFHTVCNLENVQSITGFKYGNYEEFTRPLIFIKNGKIVFFENRKSNFEGIINEQFVYKNGSYSIRNKEDSKFKVKIEESDNKKYLLIYD